MCVISERRRPSSQGALTDPCTKLNNFLNFLVDQTVGKKTPAIVKVYNKHLWRTVVVVAAAPKDVSCLASLM